MTKFGQVLLQAMKDSGLSRSEYAREWDISQRTLRHWLEDTPPGVKHLEKIMERFPSLTSNDFEEIPVEVTAHLTATTMKIMLARMNITNLIFIFEWLVLEANPDERKKFREELGVEWEHFMNLARSLVNEKSREVIQNEGRLGSSSRRKAI